MYLGIEIGGTKLQVGVGSGSTASLEILERFQIDRKAGAEGILEAIDLSCRALVEKYPVSGIGIGFGGPVDSARGIVRKSYHVAGWESFPLADWCTKRFGVPTVIENDCNVSALAESEFGAGANRRSVLYVTVGTGIGAGLVVDGKIFGATRPTITEIGHLRPFLDSDSNSIVESYSSGPGIAERYATMRKASGTVNGPELTTVDIARAAVVGDPVAVSAMDQGMKVLGWAIAQAITITAPEIVVIGGGVSLAPEKVFIDPLGVYIARYVMDALSGSYEIAVAELGESVVVHGALALAALDK